MTTKDTIIQEDGFGFAPRASETYLDGNPFEIVRRYTMTNKNGASVKLITWGAGIQSIRVPNIKGVLGDVVLGFDNIDGYVKNRYIGRMTNCVAIGIIKGNNNSSLKNDDKLYYTNGEFNGLDNVNWEAYVLDNQVVMSHLRYHNGYSNNMLIQIKYSWTDENELNMKICATATGPMPANITNYCLLNLAGHGMGEKELKNHIVTINTDKWIDLGTKNNFSSIKHRNVDRTNFDLRNPTELRKKLYAISGGGYDHNFSINSPSKFCYRFHARILHPDSGRLLELYSDQPLVKFYTANYLPDPEYKYLQQSEENFDCGCGDAEINDLEMDEKEAKRKGEEIRGKDGILYMRHGGFVLSPNSIPARIISPGKKYEHNITYKFDVRKTKND